MTPQAFHRLRRTVAPPSGQISCVDAGAGRAALFARSVLLNGFRWRYASDRLRVFRARRVSKQLSP